MNLQYMKTLTWMDARLLELTALVPNPKLVNVDGRLEIRFVEKSASQAVVQKLARVISGLRAATLLLKAGYLQEQAALCRMINEFEDDVAFLSLAGKVSPVPEKLKQYLDAFYEEEASFKQTSTGQRVKGRATVNRRDIANFIAGSALTGSDSSAMSSSTMAISFAFGGYVHGTSPHIMEMYDLNDRSFITTPQNDLGLLASHEHDIWNYYYRGILSFWFAGYLFDVTEMVEQVRIHRMDFEKATKRSS
jgi:hypothetical protein